MELNDPAAFSPVSAQCVQCGQAGALTRGAPEYERALAQEPFVFICEECKQRNHYEALVSRYTNL